MFANAIQTLSNMALNESGFEVPKTAEENLVEEFRAQVESIPLLTEAEAEFQVGMVPIHKNERFGRYLIEMEDLSRYMASSKIHNVKEAVCNILKANGLQGQYANTGLIIDEASLQNDTEGIEKLGYNYDATKEFPKNEYYNSEKGLGYGLLGKETNMARIRQIANSKRFMDVLTGRYGLPLFRKNYTDVGLMKEMAEIIEEDAQLKQPSDASVIHEGPKCNCGKAGCKICNPKKLQEDGADNEAERTEQPGDEDNFNEDSKLSLFKRNQKTLAETVSIMDHNNNSNLNEHDMQIQRIKAIAAGKLDDIP
jgi:hypothetical protein